MSGTRLKPPGKQPGPSVVDKEGTAPHRGPDREEGDRGVGDQNHEHEGVQLQLEQGMVSSLTWLPELSRGKSSRERPNKGISREPSFSCSGDSRH